MGCQSNESILNSNITSVNKRENDTKKINSKKGSLANNNENDKKLFPKESKSINTYKVDEKLFLKERNQIKKYNDIKLISVIFKIIEGSFFYPKNWAKYSEYGYPIVCENSDDFSTIIDKLFHEFPDLKEEKIDFFVNNNIINKSTTLKRNKIEDNTIILIRIL